MKHLDNFKFNDLQGLLCFGHGALTDSCFLLLRINDANAAKKWLKSAPVSSAAQVKPKPDTALQIAFSTDGLRALGVSDSIIEDFSEEFIVGMSGDESRSRRLGDIGSNSPKEWDWGGESTQKYQDKKSKQVPHVLLLLYAKKNGMDNWRKTVEGKSFAKAFTLKKELPTFDLRHKNKPIEPFGFIDGISQPVIDWARKQGTDLHDRANYSNLLATGEVVLGYPNEYGLYTTRPLIDPKNDKFAAEELPDALDQPELKDFARNGSYLVLRQLAQDVPGFWQFLAKETKTTSETPEQLAESMVGRTLNGSPLAEKADEQIPGISDNPHGFTNHFTYEQDPVGHKCPIGAHIRRSNPRTGDFPPGVTGFLSRLIRLLGFGETRPDEDLIASTRFHRLLRRGRSYGPKLTPKQAVKPNAEVADRGLQFICLVANISRQFEFVQNAWSMSNKFAGVQRESDPLLGHREPLRNEENTDQFNRPSPNGPIQKTCHLPQFITVQGGGYFFMPGLSALKYIAAIPTPTNKGDK